MNEEEHKGPRCIGIVVDGNRRWARQKRIPLVEGHRAGYKKLRDVVEWAKESSVRYLIFYAFSMENWNRPSDEVFYLMKLIPEVFTRDIEKFKRNSVRIRIIGERGRFSRRIQEILNRAEQETEQFSDYTVCFALSYGGREEILHAVQRLIQERGEGMGIATHPVTKEEFHNYLYASDIPDPDIIIRTSGEQRLSNFLTWQSAYAELFFTKTLWPDFSKEEFTEILAAYGVRDRRFGK